MDLLAGFGTVLTPTNLLWIAVGAFLGTAVGVLPGLGSAMAVALLLPLTFTLEPISALTMFAGIYFGGLFGDSIAGILMNTPGNSTAIASSFEGHQMALSGRAPQALATAAIGAFLGGMIATVLVVFFPKEYLYAGISVFAAFGVYAAGASTVDLAVMIAIGVIGFVMRRYDVPLAPVLIALILGPLAEYSLRDAMANSSNNAAVLVSSPITIALYLILIAGVVWNAYRRVQEKNVLAALEAAQDR